MKQTFIFSALVAFACCGLAQSRHEIDSLKAVLAVAKNDTSRVLALANLCSDYQDVVQDSAIIYGLQALALARQSKFLRGEAASLAVLGFAYRILGDIPKSLDFSFKGVQIAQENHYTPELTNCLVSLWYAYWELNDYPEAIKYIRQAIEIHVQTHGDSANLANLMNNLAATYTENMQLDSASKYIQNSLQIIDKANLAGQPWTPWVLMTMGNLQEKLGKHKEALAYWQKALQINAKTYNRRMAAYVFTSIAAYFKSIGNADSCIYYAEKGLYEAGTINFTQGMLETSGMLADECETKDVAKALYYLKTKELVNEKLYGAKKVRELQKTLSDEQKRQREVDDQKTAYQNSVKQYSLLAGLAVFLLIAFLLYRTNWRQRNANKVLRLQKEEIQTTLAQLKATQSQLVQSEKMASLGELTAGIAHEIQNPLNFVNNFSEVNKDLLAEMKGELDNGNIDEAKAIANDVINNEDKINHHGRRADAIVKGMLQHSRASTGQKELTDINVLADEYLRLSYHGLRAKDKSFNAEMCTSFDENAGKISLVPQDIGRVLLNLFNNAFYAVGEKAKTATMDYKPTVSVSSKKKEGKVMITVADNGNGIPEKIKDKIFQPFFTTKPAGKGTGLGLSLSYDIVRAHGGEINIETNEGEGTTFSITLLAV